MNVIAHTKRLATFACGHDWWTWDHPQIRNAMQAARLVHVTAVIERALEENIRLRRSPSSWSEFCGINRIRRDGNNLMKMRRGSHAFTDLVLLGIATSLCIDLRLLYPTADEWIAQATVELCGARITMEDAKQYWRNRLRQKGGHAQSNGQPVTVDQVAVERVLDLLEPKLRDIDRELEQRGRVS